MSNARISSADLLSLLREWGWEAGISRLRQSDLLIDDGDHSDEPSDVRNAVLGWQAVERGEFVQAEEMLQSLVDSPEFQGWAQLGLAFMAMRSRQPALAMERTKAAEAHALNDPALLGAIRLLQGSTRFHNGDHDGVLEILEESAQLTGPDRFSYGRVLDCLGMWYANKGNVQAAIEFYEQSLRHKQQFEDESGLALTHGQLGRLYLDWGQFKLAEHHFQKDLEICRRISDVRGEAQMYNFLGVVAMNCDELENAAADLDRAIEFARIRQWTVLEGYARKDRAMCWYQAGDVAAAYQQVEAAQALFEAAKFKEGVAHTDRVRGILLRDEEQWIESDQCLRRAHQFFERVKHTSEVARTRLEIARTTRARGSQQSTVRDEYLLALESAEYSRRPHLVQAVDRELAQVDPNAAARQVYRRVRGKRIDEDSTSLTSAEEDEVTMFFFDLQGFTAWSHQTDPSVVMLSLNQMMATFLVATTSEDIQVIEYMGDGFLAMSRGPHHAVRAVRAALKLYDALDQFNRPRRILNLSEFACRIGVSSGKVVLGNIGTYEKIDYRAVGSSVNLAARIQNVAIPGCPCLSQATWELVQHEFTVTPESPRLVELKGLGEVQIYDVLRPQSTDP